VDAPVTQVDSNALEEEAKRNAASWDGDRTFSSSAPPATTPEPATFDLIGGVLAGLVRRRRKDFLRQKGCRRNTMRERFPGAAGGDAVGS
jgi:hypothetical protein